VQKFEDTKEATKSRKSKEDTQYNDKKKKTQGQAKIYKTLHRKQISSNTNSTTNWGWTRVLQKESIYTTTIVLCLYPTSLSPIVYVP
jgi:hypothetical protein